MERIEVSWKDEDGQQRYFLCDSCFIHLDGLHCHRDENFDNEIIVPLHRVEIIGAVWRE